MKRILTKGIRLEKALKYYEDDKKNVFEKFEAVWGTSLANHFLSKYSDAESLIWALDADNLQLFIDKY